MFLYWHVLETIKSERISDQRLFGTELERWKCPEVDLHWSRVEFGFRLLLKAFFFLWAASKLIIKLKSTVQFSEENNVQIIC